MKAAAEVRVLISGGFASAYKLLEPLFEAQTGMRLVTVHGPSMGATQQSIPQRLQRGEPADVVIAARSTLDTLEAQGLVVKGSTVDLVHSPIGVAVRSGAPLPDISSAEALRKTLLAAKSIAYSDSASGVYVSGELFKRLGIADDVRSKARKIEATPVGQIVEAGGAEVGLQQLSELMPVQGITIVGLLPDAVQKLTIFSAAVATSAKSLAAAQALIQLLSSPKAWPAIQESGLLPASKQGSSLTA